MTKAAKKFGKADATKARAQTHVNSYRERMKRQGFRLMQVWVPDVNSPEFRKEFARQTASAGPITKEDKEWMDAALVEVLPGWDPL